MTEKKLPLSPQEMAVLVKKVGTPFNIYDGDEIEKNAEEMKAAGFNADSYVSEGSAHEFLTWRRSLKEFAQKIFK